MHILIEQQALVSVLEHVRGVVERRNTIPILSNVKLAASGGKLTVVATDLDIEITESVDCSVVSAGKATVQAHLLHDIARKMPKGSQVKLELVEHDIRVSAARSNFKLVTLPTEDFPEMDVGKMDRTFDIPAPVLRTMLAKVAVAISTEETRYYLNGVFLHGTDSMLRTVATDGHRLVRHEVEAPEGSANMDGIIVPRKTVGELRRLLDGVEGDVTVGTSGSKVRFTFGNTRLLSKLIDGNFPPYERVIPQNNPHVLTMITADLVGVVDRAGAILTSGRAIAMKATSHGARFYAANSGEGTVTEEVDANYEGPDLEIGFNYKYLGNLAAGIVGPNVSFTLLDAGSPAVITDSEDPATLYVLMPMRV